MDRPPFESLVLNIKDEVRYNTEKRLEKTWVSLAKMWFNNNEAFKKLPVLFDENPPVSFTPEKPIIIPLLGEGKLEIGRSQYHWNDHEQQRTENRNIVIKISSPSHRSEDQNEGKQFSCEVTLTNIGSIYGANVNLLQKKGKYPTEEENRLLQDAVRFMALFDPQKDINWAKLAQPTAQQKIILDQAGFHPPPAVPLISTT